jgi:hypothetical protein
MQCTLFCSILADSACAVLLCCGCQCCYAGWGASSLQGNCETEVTMQWCTEIYNFTEIRATCKTHKFSTKIITDKV